MLDLISGCSVRESREIFLSTGSNSNNSCLTSLHLDVGTLVSIFVTTFRTKSAPQFRCYHRSYVFKVRREKTAYVNAESLYTFFLNIKRWKIVNCSYFSFTMQNKAAKNKSRMVNKVLI